MKVLVLYQLHHKTDRNTIKEHLNCFRRYSNHLFHYFNVIDGIPTYLENEKYDVVIFHYTFLAGERFLPDVSFWERKIFNSQKLAGFKIAIPQDEYDHTERLCSFFEYAKIDRVYTCFTKEKDIDKAYRNNLNINIDFRSTLTGFVDSKTSNLIKGRIIPYGRRPIDIGYRARKLPAYFGGHGQIKFNLIKKFNQALEGSNFTSDISSTNDNFVNENSNKVKLGNHWLNFLLNCNAFIGCEGGSSLLDFDGSIKKCVNDFVERNPKGSFSQIEAHCFPKLDYNIECFAISPRHFECALTKTLQLLVEGEYGGIFKPNIHYIPIKKDLSNISDVINKLSDVAFCQTIVDNAYNDIILKDQFTYKSFVQSVFHNFSRPKWYSQFNFMFKIKGLIFELRNPYLRFLLKLNVFYSDNKYYLYRRFVLPNPLLRQVLSFIKDLLTFKFFRR